MTMMRMWGWAAATALLVMISNQAEAQSRPPVGLEAAEGAASAARATDSGAPRTVRGCCTSGPLYLDATSVGDSEIDIDGAADEDPWARASTATDFVQFSPNEGDLASERTEARVIYGEDALFVFMYAYDTAPGEIVGQLTRRDQDSYSDLLGVVIDSYFDRRTAFHFAVNPVGVKYDIYRFNDTQEDSGWDAVWDVSTARTSDGWTAEFRIPYSQLRFRDADEQTWGINFMRQIARRDEMTVWAPTARSDGAIVSRFGELRGLQNLSAPNRMEMLPYTVASLQRAPGNPDDPFYARNAANSTAGVDVKYGVTSDLTLDVTINPDFGQVEADPAQVNLSAFEVFLPEQRPFFLEGSSIFNFSIALGDGPEATESLFYSRRVGRSPQGWADPQGGYADVEDHTTILGAWKLSGKTSSGWSIGAMHAVTSEEQAKIAPLAGDPFQQTVEPFSNYGVLRVQKDFRDGRSALGFIGTGLVRNGSDASELRLRSNAWSGGVDFRHRFAADTWQVDGYVLGSHVAGSAEAIARTQRAPARFYHRPDAEHLRYDPTRTSLSGASANVGISKFAGGFWRVGTGLQTRTPGFEINDVGFQNRADYVVTWGWLGYHRNQAQGPFRNWMVNVNGWNVLDYDGNRIGTGANINVNGQFRSFWRGHAGMNQEFESYSNGALRGGPLFRREAQTNVWGGFGTDGRKPLQLNLNGWGNVRPESDSWAYGVSPNVRIRPSGRATFTVGAFLNRNVNDRQWVKQISTDRDHYVFGRLDQTTLGLTARVDYAFTPTVSLQFYAQPFVSAGSYSGLKQIADPVAATYAERFSSLATRMEAGWYRTDLNGDGNEESIRNPDFNFKQFRSNAVLRWEYLPGSTLFFVWSQGRDDYVQDRSFNFDRDVRDLFSVAPDNIFMIKLSYWMSR
ncbi:MAG: DUF5916 domain-containing protein [Gemmatimonadota bacterium]|nr:DUF5916 domain-containing protein [Gemmatimonadota bacterium]